MNGAEAVLDPQAMVLEDLRESVHELYQLMISMQRLKVNDKRWKESIDNGCRELAKRFEAMKQSLEDEQRRLRKSLDDVERLLQEFSDELSAKPSVRKLKELRRSLSEGYEEMVTQLRGPRIRFEVKAKGFKHVKLPNYSRNVFHAIMGTSGVLLYQWILTREMALWVMGLMMASFVLLEISRIFSRKWSWFLVDTVFGQISRPAERYRINGSTLYLAALILVVFFFPKTVAQIAVLVPAYADPLASVFGQRYGRKKLYRAKSYVGTGTFFLAGALSVVIFGLLALPDWSLLRLVGMALTVGATGAFAECFSERIDDNFTIPLLCAGVAMAWF